VSARVAVQFTQQLRQHDGVGNEVLALHDLLRSCGLESHICCQLTDQPSARHVRSPRSCRRLNRDLLLVHYSHGPGPDHRLFSAHERRVLLYHGITPPHYFRGTNPRLEAASRQAYDDLPRYREYIDLALAHSHYSAQELERAGFRNVLVFPYVLHEPLYTLEPDRSLLQQYGRDGWINLLTVGRLAPNKGVEDCIFVFDYFKRFIERKSRLFVVGSWDGMEAYAERLARLVSRLGTPDVIFTGPVPQSSLIAFFKLAHAYLCMSEHEGFCVPLVEAMRFGVPVFAYAATAIPETLRGTGVVFAEKSWPTVAETIGLLLADAELRRRVIEEQVNQAAFFSFGAARRRFRRILESLGVLEPAEAEESR
jgi:glycosyltransferase involved in cell wall biosynthesis